MEPTTTTHEYEISDDNSLRITAQFHQERANTLLRNKINVIQRKEKLDTLNLEISHIPLQLELYQDHKDEDLALISPIFQAQRDQVIAKEDNSEAKELELTLQKDLINRKLDFDVGSIKASLSQRGFGINTNLIYSIKKTAKIQLDIQDAKIAQIQDEIDDLAGRIAEINAREQAAITNVEHQFEARQMGLLQRLSVLNTEVLNTNNIPAFQQTLYAQSFGTRWRTEGKRTTFPSGNSEEDTTHYYTGPGGLTNAVVTPGMDVLPFDEE